MTTPTAHPRRRRKLALVGALVGAVVSLGAISGQASAGNLRPTGTIATTGEVVEMAAKSSGIRW